MSGPIQPMLWAWAALSPLAFRLLPGRDAAIACLVAGWALLPVEPYPPSSLSVDGLSSSIHAVAIPTPVLANKATSIGLGCLAGLILFDRRAFDRLRFDFVDVPIAVFCLVPLASTAANGLPMAEGLAQVRYLGLAWGVPYVLGRVYLMDPESRARFAIGMAAGGLAYLPLCLLEVVLGPTAYRVAYGPHPYEFEGAARFLGHRPLGFLEHGNQLGMWMSSSAVAATWLWASGAVKRPGGVPGGALAAVLIGTTLLCQSHGGIVLLGLALVPLLVARSGRVHFPVKWVAVVVLVAGSLAVVLLAARKGFDVRSLRLEIAGFFKGINKSSFTWRLARSWEFLPTALQRPWLGWGRADWRPDGLTFINPVNLPLWLLDLGMYGLLGLAALLTTWLLPLIRSARRGGRSWTGPSDGATGALVALVAVNFLDGFSNSVVILPILAAVGGLNQPSPRTRAAT